MDDLSEGRGAEFVDRSELILVFCSRGYADSPNCMRELLRAIFDEKPLIALLEPEAKHGGMTHKEISGAMDVASSNFRRWGLSSEMDEWGMSPPLPYALAAALLESATSIEWNRIGAFQDVTLRLIAKALLRLSAGTRPWSASTDVYVQSEVARQTPVWKAPAPGYRAHIYVSRHNLGAVYLMRELAGKLGVDYVMPTRQSYAFSPGAAEDSPSPRHVGARIPLFASSSITTLRECHHMLVDLDERTWTSGHASELFAAEVKEAMERKVHLLLAHEMVSMGQEGRHPCEFESFFRCDRGSTPANLLQAGIYNEIAVALRGGEWREVSMVLLTNAIIQGVGDEGLNLQQWLRQLRRSTPSGRSSSSVREGSFVRRVSRRASKSQSDARSARATVASVTRCIDHQAR